MWEQHFAMELLRFSKQRHEQARTVWCLDDDYDRVLIQGFLYVLSEVQLVPNSNVVSS